MYPIKSKISIFSVIGFGLNLALIYTFLRLWISPKVSDVDLIWDLIMLICFEFFTIHSGLLMMHVARTWKNWLMLIALYGAFAILFNFAVSGNQIFILYGSVMLNRILSTFLNPEKTARDKKMQLMTSCYYAVFYISLIVFLGFFQFLVPEFGLTKEFLTAAKYSHLSDDGLVGEPNLIMCWGVLYYLAMIAFDVMMMTKRGDKLFAEYERINPPKSD